MTISTTRCVIYSSINSSISVITHLSQKYTTVVYDLVNQDGSIPQSMTSGSS